MADHKKISGVLIENVIKNNQLQATIIGFGLNINQTHFEDLPQATSMQMVSGRYYDLDEVLQSVIINLKYYFELIKAGQLEELKALYETELFRKNKPSTFEDAEGSLFTGFINGVTNSGHLQVLVEDNIIKEFDLKAIKLRY